MAYYNPKRSSNWNYGGANWKLSRSKIDLFMECPRCFYIDNKLGVKRPGMPSFQLNKAVDNQLKKEFDVHRANGTQHSIQSEYGIDARPVMHPLINTWRENFEGVQFFHAPTGLLVSGAIDDLWINGSGEYNVVDYKATAKETPVTKLDSEWHDGYKRQIEVYQWLLRRNELPVSDVGYFVYCTGKYDQEAFDKVIEFDVALIPYKGNDSWVEPILFRIKDCLESPTVPSSTPTCEFCAWYNARTSYETVPKTTITKTEVTEVAVETKTKPAKRAAKPAAKPTGATLF